MRKYIFNIIEHEENSLPAKIKYPDITEFGAIIKFMPSQPVLSVQYINEINEQKEREKEELQSV